MQKFSVVFADKYFILYPHKHSQRAENSVCTVIFYFIPKYITRKRLLNVWSLGIAGQGQAVQYSCEANKVVFEFLFTSFFHLKDYI